jgi:tetratricopeptide (TPR) repeat protein
MATTKRITRKEIKQPDEFITFSARTIEFAQTHTREIMIGVASVLALGLLIWAVSAYSNKKEAQASLLLAQAQALLEPISAQAQAGQPVPVESKSDPEAAARALALLQDVVENYKRTEASRVARILLGQRYYEEGDYDAAIDTYEAFLKKANPKPELKAMAREGLAYALEAKEDFAQAAICYEELSKSSLTNVQGWAYLGMARCYERLGEEQRATDAYRALLSDHPQHPKAEEARANIARLTQSLDQEAPAEDLRDSMPDGGAPGMD